MTDIVERLRRAAVDGDQAEAIEAMEEAAADIVELRRQRDEADALVAAWSPTHAKLPPDYAGLLASIRASLARHASRQGSRDADI